MAGTPLGFLLSLIGVVIDKNKRPAIIGLIASGSVIALFFVLTLCAN